MACENRFIMMYHGAVMPERGIENLIEVLAVNSEVWLFILGDGQPEYIESLRCRAEDRNVLDRIVFHCSVPLGELWKYIGASDVGMVTGMAAWRSYYLSLPNKFFENIQAENPVICSDFPAMKALIEKYALGLTCNPDSVEDINRCVETLRNDKSLCEKYAANARRAKEELCWEKERLVLKEAYGRIL